MENKEDIQVYDKLVRDEIPAIIRKAGKKVVSHRIKDDKEYIEYLIKKLKEESDELLEAYAMKDNHADIIESNKQRDNYLYELVDITEVYEELLRMFVPKVVARKEFLNMRKRKSRARGKFKNRTVLDTITEQ